MLVGDKMTKTVLEYAMMKYGTAIYDKYKNNYTSVMKPINLNDGDVVITIKPEDLVLIIEKIQQMTLLEKAGNKHG